MEQFKNFIDNNKKLVYITLAVLVIALGVVMWWVYQMPSPSTTINYNNQQAGQNQQNTSGNTSSTPSTSQTLSYNDALVMYQDKRIQFDENCTVFPSYTTFKKGIKIMLDNRASKSRQVYLDGQAYSLAAYGFKVITLTTSSSLPHTIMIDCGNGKNNGRILLQQ